MESVGLKVIQTPSITSITADELNDRIKRNNTPALLIDVRTPEECQQLWGHIENAIHIPLKDLKKNLHRFEEYKDKEVVTICTGGGRSYMGALILAQCGFMHIRNLEHGMMSWYNKDYPIVKDLKNIGGLGT